MTTNQQTIMLIEDVLPLARTYEAYLHKAGYNVVAEILGAEALKTLRQYRPAALVLDLHLPDINGIEVLRETRVLYPDLPIIVITADTSAEIAAAAMNEGAFDFILKPFTATRLNVTIRNALERKALEREVIEWRQTLGHSQFHGIIGQSPVMQAVYRIIESVAASKASVFITGESGTGKEMAAHALHQASMRRVRPFIAVNCGAIPHNLMESQIFGHVKGAFTGAISDHKGAARAAHGGTLFLDEIGELPLELQVKLLRFLQTGEVMPVGSEQTEVVDVRIIAATNRDPREEVKAGRLREDLYYRLHVVPLDMPPLRDREDDVLLLADYFVQKFSFEDGKNFISIHPEAARMLRQFDWPGNVRQLENVIRHTVVVHDSSEILPGMLPAEFQIEAPVNRLTAPISNPINEVKPLWLVEKETILGALEHTDQDITKAAALLEVSPSTLYRKLQSWKTGTAA